MTTIINMLSEREGKIHATVTNDKGVKKRVVVDKPEERLLPNERDEYVVRKAFGQ